MTAWNVNISGPVTANELREARTVSNERKDQIMRQELDAAADQVRAMVTEIAELTTERDAARWQSAVQFVTLTRERDQWHRRADVALSAGESARAGLAAATALVHDMDARNAELRRQLADRDAELADMESQRDQAIYERDSARVAS